MAPELNDFTGDWRLTRQILPQGGAPARFEGRARFDPAPQGLRYFESGTLVLPGQPPMQAERAYLWRAEGGQICVDYADGRPFHAFDPAHPEARHWCDPDDYLVRYDFGHWPRWRARWQVRGPRKDYTLISDYGRG